MAGIFHLKGTVKHYDWGGKNFIPTLLRVPNPSNLPFAEYWLGSHPQDKVMVDLPKTGWTSFRDFLLKRNTDLPYLLKILDVDDMLSIQVHPSRAAAVEGFARENAIGIPLDAPDRNYKDENHKQELMVALGDFWLLQGFKPGNELLLTLSRRPELIPLLLVFELEGYEGLYRHLMRMPQESVNGILSPLLRRVLPLYKENKLHKNDPDFWVAKAAINFQKDENLDRGIFSIYLLNLIFLETGQAVFQDAGTLHAYLEGKNVEIMTSSDNVLRGGLTHKHIDVNELLKHVNYTQAGSLIIEPIKLNDHEFVYPAPSNDFRLSRYDLPGDNRLDFTTHSAEIILITEGSVEIADDKLALELRPGSPAAVVMPGVTISVKALSHASLFRASH